MSDQPDAADAGLCRRWWTFVLERFPPFAHIPLIAFIVLANASIGAALIGKGPGVSRLAVALVVAVLFFFRLRCFDEIKDYRVDIELNPTRPLARGLLKVGDVKRMFLLLTVAELVLAGGLGVNALATHVLAVAYSYLMYREFFIGRMLRPHLTTYAVTHTFVSILLGWSVAAQVTGVPFWRFAPGFLLFSVVNWMIFDVFEFARKTFAPDEETPGADSYSRRFTPKGAVGLCLSQVVLAAAILAFVPAEVLPVPGWWPGPGWTPYALLAFLPAVAGVVFAVRPVRRTAKTYRALAGVYQLLFYLFLAFQGMTATGG